METDMDFNAYLDEMAAAQKAAVSWNNSPRKTLREGWYELELTGAKYDLLYEKVFDEELGRKVPVLDSAGNKIPLGGSYINLFFTPCAEEGGTPVDENFTASLYWASPLPTAEVPGHALPVDEHIVAVSKSYNIWRTLFPDSFPKKAVPTKSPDGKANWNVQLDAEGNEIDNVRADQIKREVECAVLARTSSFIKELKAGSNSLQGTKIFGYVRPKGVFSNVTKMKPIGAPIDDVIYGSLEAVDLE